MKNKLSQIIFCLFIIFFGFCLSETFAGKNKILAEIKYKQAVLLMDSSPLFALKQLTIAAKLNPREPKIPVAIGKIYRKQKLYQKAIDAFQKAIKIRKNYVDAYSNLGYTYVFLKEWDKAIQSFRFILRYPNSTAPYYVHNAIGWAYYEKNDFKKSIIELKKAIRFKYNYPNAYYNFGLSLLGLEDYEEAIKKFKIAIEYNPDFVQAHNHLALIYLKKNMHKEAQEIFLKVIELAPDSQPAKEAKKYLDLIG
jgi:tetratricopeptide (TPR) repeat protein